MDSSSYISSYSYGFSQRSVETPAEEALSVSAVLKQLETRLKGFSATIVGEVSEVSDKPGYKAVYFTLRDEASALPCLMWRNDFARAGIDIRQGMRVEVSGYFSLYAAKGRMNFTAKTLRMAGEGDLRLKVAQLAKKLEALGYMDPTRKKALPKLPLRIGLVTSPRGKAVQDVLRTLRRRFPLATVVVAGVPVEGPTAVASLCQGLKALDEDSCDVILLVRGGGSYEDLMPFNDEALALAIVECKTPVVSGIGHEPDTTIADMVCDLRASTPTGAAEAATQGAENLRQSLNQDARRLSQALRNRVDSSAVFLQHMKSRQIFANADMLLESYQQNLDFTAMRLKRAIPDALAKSQQNLTALQDRLIRQGTEPFKAQQAALVLHAARLQDLSPLSTLTRGYAMATDEGGHVVSSVKQTSSGASLSVLFTDGTAHCTVNDIDATPVVDSDSLI